MFCIKCGFENAESSLFCRQCGLPLNAAENPPQQPSQAQEPPPPAQQPPQAQTYAALQSPAYHQPPYPPQAPPQRPKKKIGLVIGLVAGGIVLAAAAVLLYLFVLNGTPVQGDWHCAERGWVLSFSNEGNIKMHSLSGTASTTFEFDKGKAQGQFTADGTSYMFKIKDDRLALSSGSSQATFKRLSGNVEIQPLVLAALEGTWTSEEIGEVLRLKDGSLYVYSRYGDFKGSYKYDIYEGEGIIKLHGENYAFCATHEELDIPDIGHYTKASENLDIDAFMSEFGSPLLGTWYDSSGEHGTVTFYENGTAEVVTYGEAHNGAYTFDTQNGTGTITVNDAQYPFVMSRGILTVNGISYTRDYVMQASVDTWNNALLGVWYEGTGMYGTVSFYEDGTAQVNMFGITYFGTYNYDTSQGYGELTIDFLDGDIVPIAFSLGNGKLNLEGIEYIRDHVPEVIHIVGVWYDMDGESGTLYFDEFGGVYMDTYGTFLMGTYAFDAQSLSGTMTIQFDDAPLTFGVYLANGFLTVDDKQYTRMYVAQPYYEYPMAG